MDYTTPTGHQSPVVEIPQEYPDEEESAILLPCSICSRTFAPTALQRHEKVCEKLQCRRRRIFDSTKQRIEGLDTLPSGLNILDKNEVKKKSLWREKHQEFLITIRAAKGSREDLLERSDGECSRHIPFDYVQCLHCERYFGPKAADRHINWCEEQKNRLPRSYTSEDNQAIQRLKTRTKYTPPKPGLNGWRAPKKRDVISSIPPSNVGPNITPPGRLISPPPPVQRQASPPSHDHLNYSHRQIDPPPSSFQRKGSYASLPYGDPQYTTSSLGRNTKMQFTSMLESVTGCSPGYGASSGYGSHFLYGASHGPNHPLTFTRSVSLKLPRRRPTGAGKMARHRDLASDMLASVTLGGKAEREEPEGDEDSKMYRYIDRPISNRMENVATYDPYSAAELQFQDLLEPSKRDLESYNRPHFMGSTCSLRNLMLRKFSIGRDLSQIQSKPHATNLMGGPSFRLSSLGINYFDINPPHLRSHSDDDSSELETLEHSPRVVCSPDCGQSSMYVQQPCLDSASDCLGPLQSGTERRTRSDSLSSQSNKSLFGLTFPRNHPRASSSEPFSSHPGFNRKSLSKEGSPSPQTTKRSINLQHINFEENPQNVSSSSSADSLPNLSSSPSISSPPGRSKFSSASKSSLPSFCYECGNKYPVGVAKFCCHCGSKRLSVAQ